MEQEIAWGLAAKVRRVWDRRSFRGLWGRVSNSKAQGLFPTFWTCVLKFGLFFYSLILILLEVKKPPLPPAVLMEDLFLIHKHCFVRLAEDRASPEARPASICAHALSHLCSHGESGKWFVSTLVRRQLLNWKSDFGDSGGFFWNMFYTFWYLESLRFQTAAGHLANGRFEQVINCFCNWQQAGPGPGEGLVRQAWVKVWDGQLLWKVCVCTCVSTDKGSICLEVYLLSK